MMQYNQMMMTRQYQAQQYMYQNSGDQGILSQQYGEAFNMILQSMMVVSQVTG